MGEPAAVSAARALGDACWNVPLLRQREQIREDLLAPGVLGGVVQGGDRLAHAVSGCRRVTVAAQRVAHGGRRGQEP